MLKILISNFFGRTLNFKALTQKAVIMSKNKLPADTLFLTIKKIQLDKIIAGTKKTEYRDYTDYYLSRFYDVDENDNLKQKPFKYVLFQAGYSRGALRAKFELKGIYPTEYIDKIPSGFKKGDVMFELEIGKQVEI